MMYPGVGALAPWVYPDNRYYDDWYDEPKAPPGDHELKSRIVDRLRENPRTARDDIQVEVDRAVVVLSGKVSSPRAKRAAADDAWDTAGVADVDNQLVLDA